MGVNDQHPEWFSQKFHALKVIKLITCVFGGDGYLNFIGNEFGHPEWIDFPAERNGFNFDKARRRFDLAEDPNLLYNKLKTYEKGMLKLLRDYEIHKHTTFVLNIDEIFQKGHVRFLIAKRAALLFIFNLGFTDETVNLYDIAGQSIDHKPLLVFNTKWPQFGRFIDSQNVGEIDLEKLVIGRFSCLVFKVDDKHPVKKSSKTGQEKSVRGPV